MSDYNGSNVFRVNSLSVGGEGFFPYGFSRTPIGKTVNILSFGKNGFHGFWD